MFKYTNLQIFLFPVKSLSSVFKLANLFSHYSKSDRVKFNGKVRSRKLKSILGENDKSQRQTLNANIVGSVPSHGPPTNFFKIKMRQQAQTLEPIAQNKNNIGRHLENERFSFVDYSEGLMRSKDFIQVKILSESNTGKCLTTYVSVSIRQWPFLDLYQQKCVLQVCVRNA